MEVERERGMDQTQQEGDGLAVGHMGDSQWK